MHKFYSIISIIRVFRFNSKMTKCKNHHHPSHSAKSHMLFDQKYWKKHAILKALVEFISSHYINTDKLIIHHRDIKIRIGHFSCWLHLPGPARLTTLPKHLRPVNISQRRKMPIKQEKSPSKHRHVRKFVGVIILRYSSVLMEKCLMRKPRKT